MCQLFAWRQRAVVTLWISTRWNVLNICGDPRSPWTYLVTDKLLVVWVKAARKSGDVDRLLCASVVCWRFTCSCVVASSFTSRQQLRESSSMILSRSPQSLVLTRSGKLVVLAALVAVGCCPCHTVMRIAEDGSTSKPITRQTRLTKPVLSSYRSGVRTSGVDVVGPNNIQMYGFHTFRRCGCQALCHEIVSS